MNIFNWFSRRKSRLVWITKQDLKEMENRLMATQADITAQLKAQTVVLNKIGNETDLLIKKVEDLKTAIENQPEVTPELAAAAQALEDQVKAVDDKVPDAVPVPV